MLLVYVDTAILNGVSAVNQRLVLHWSLVKVGTQRCWRRLGPGRSWRARGWLLRIEHKVLRLRIVAVVVVVVAVVRDQIRMLRQRLLGRGVGKPCLLLVIRGERRDVGRRNGEGGKRTWATRSGAEVQRPRKGRL
jgi:hypothetical protein